MPSIKFLKAYTVADKVETAFEAGQVVELPEASAKHFISRGIAEESKEKPTPPKKSKPKAAEKAKETPASGGKAV